MTDPNEESNDTMTPETNKLIIQRFTDELINTASASLAAELIAPNAALYVPGDPEPLRGPAGFLAIVEMMRGGFPDIQWTLEDMAAEGDKVAARFTIRGTHRGPFFWRSADGEGHRRAKHVVLPTSRWADR